MYTSHKRHCIKNSLSATLAVSTVVRHFHGLRCVRVSASSSAVCSLTLRLLLHLFCSIAFAFSPLLYHSCGFQLALSPSSSSLAVFYVSRFSFVVSSVLPLLSRPMDPGLAVQLYFSRPICLNSLLLLLCLGSYLLLLFLSFISLPPYVLLSLISSGLKLFFYSRCHPHLQSVLPATASV